jgi:hypothetical protein
LLKAASPRSSDDVYDAAWRCIRAVRVALVSIVGIIAPAIAVGQPVADQPDPRPVHVTRLHHNELIVDPRHPIAAPERTDCNWNGIPDSVDIAEGTEDDVNHNGVIDNCDSDTTLCVQRADCRDTWRLLSTKPDTSYFWSAHAPDGTILLRYTIPPHGARVSLTAERIQGVHAIKIIKPSRRASGAYELSWDKRDPATHKAVPPGLYRLTLTIGKRTYTRRVHWAEL